MKLSVTQNKIEITEKSIVNQGEYKITPCKFEFTDAYKTLVKKAVFTDLNTNKAYERPIVENECDIPANVLEAKG
ncbi:hypothetical protein, partial [Klebsiella pneumoniae]|uniref:hypothetical protein n=1 Tax=Klebsiella pneumoniae TaxID=573 RepID=UPI0025A0D00F